MDIREKLQLLGQSLELVYLNPLHFENFWQGDHANAIKSLTRVLAVFSGISVGVGSRLIAPPYDSWSFVGIVFASFINTVLFLFFPYFAGSLLDAFAQEKDRKGSAGTIRGFISIAMSIYVLYTPLMMVFLGLGFSGLIAGYVGLFLLFVGQGLVIGRGVKYIHEFKNQDAFRLTFISLALSFVYPLFFNLYIAFTMLNMAI